MTRGLPIFERIRPFLSRLGKTQNQISFQILFYLPYSNYLERILGKISKIYESSLIE